MNPTVKTSLIALVVMLLINPLLQLIYSGTSEYTYTILYSILFSTVVLIYFNQLLRLNINYKYVILIALCIPVVLYHLYYLQTFCYYHLFRQEELQQIEAQNQEIEGVKGSGGILSFMPAFRSPLYYSVVDSLTQNKLTDMIRHFQYKDYLLLLLKFLSLPIVLLTYFSKYQLFKKLSIQPLYSILFPFNYFASVTKFKLPGIWKLYLLIPIVNFIFMYKINKKITEERQLPKGSALGFIFLPFIFYPMAAFNYSGIQTTESFLTPENN